MRTNDDNQEGGGLERGVVIRKRGGANLRLFCFSFFLVFVKNLMLSSLSSSSAVFWVFLFFPVIYLFICCFWGTLRGGQQSLSCQFF